MAGPTQEPFGTPAMKPFINRWAGFVIFCCYVTVFRLSDVVYLAAMRNMASATTLYTFDIQMACYASFIGMTMIFPILFRLKFRFTTRKILTFVTIALMTMNVCVMHIRFMPLLVLFGFISGAIRIWGMFECMSSIMPGITPERDFSKFFAVIYFAVLGFIQLTGWICTNVTYLWGWQAMNCLDIALLLIVLICVRVLMHDHRFGPPMSLYGIDITGAALWSLVLGLITFVSVYGEHLQWFHSKYICAASALVLLFLGINLDRMRRIRHPYIEARTFRFPYIMEMMGMFMVMCFLASAQSNVQNSFTAGVLHFDTLNMVRLNIPQFVGIALGAVFCWHALTRKWTSYKTLTMTGFACIGAYLAMMYILIDPGTNIEKMYLPVALLGAGNVIVYISLTVYAQKTVPFQWFMQSLCVLGFIRTGIANPLSGAIFTRWTEKAMVAHSSLLGSLYNGPLAEAASVINTQATLATYKEIFGWCFVICVASLLLMLASRYRGSIRYLVPADGEFYKKLFTRTRRSYGKSKYIKAGAEQ